MKNKGTLLAITILLIISSCKKEQLYFQKVERVDSYTTSRLNRVQFIDDTTCIIAGGQKYLKAEILISRDGGYTWQVDSFPQSGKGLYGMATAPDGTMYFTGFDGTIVASHDKGNSWQEKRLGNWEYHVGVSFVNNNKAVFINTRTQKEGSIVVADTNQNILKSKDYDFGMNDVQMVNAQTGYIAAYGAILKTTDGGDNFELLDINNDNFYALDCKSENEVWVCGYAGTILHTTDGGATWDKLRNGNSVTIPKYHLLDITFKDANNGFAVGESGLVIYTSDAGQTWKKYNAFTEQALRSITYCPDGTLLTVGDGGVIYRLHP